MKHKDVERAIAARGALRASLAWGAGRRRRGPQRKEATNAMKTMTCRQLGGACDLQLQGKTADDVIKAQDRHLKDAVQGGDSAHEQAQRDMKNRWKHPIASMGWYRDTKKAFAELPED